MIEIEEMEVAGETEEGVVEKIGKPVEVQTKYGKSYRIPITIKVRNTTYDIGLFVREKSIQKGVFHPRSNIYKLLVKYGAKKLKDLVGKKVQLRIDARGFYRFVV